MVGSRDNQQSGSAEEILESPDRQPADKLLGGEGGDDTEARIRARAYSLWEEAGRPEGREAEHWEAARREIEAAKRPDAAPPM